MINAFLSVCELQFGPRKCIGDSKLVQKIRQCFHFFQKNSAGERALLYLQCQNKKVVSDGASPLFSTVFQGNGQDNNSCGKSVNHFKLSSPFLKAESVLQIRFEDLLLIPAYILQSHSSVSS